MLTNQYQGNYLWRELYGTNKTHIRPVFMSSWKNISFLILPLKITKTTTTKNQKEKECTAKFICSAVKIQVIDATKDKVRGDGTYKVYISSQTNSKDPITSWHYFTFNYHYQKNLPTPLPNRSFSLWIKLMARLPILYKCKAPQSFQIRYF